MKYGHIINRLSSLSLIVVLLVLAGTSVWITFLNQQAARAVELSTSKSELYREALYDVTIEESVQFEYVLKPSPFLKKEHQVDASAFTALLEHLQRDDYPVDGEFVGRVLIEQKAYLSVSEQYFEAIDIHDLLLAQTIHYQEIDPVFDSSRRK